jgi:ATP-dependent DNA helicase DinG
MGMDKNLIDYFPKDFVPRPIQIEVLNKIQEAIKQGHKYIICNLPTGSGKSFIPSTLANYAKDPSSEYLDSFKFGGMPNNDKEYESFGCMTLTVTKSLQDQYDNLFDHGSVLKGKKNYQCVIDDTFDCEFGPCNLSAKTAVDCKNNRICYYQNAKIDTFKSKFAILNYSMFLSSIREINKRQFIVCDEAAEIEDELVDFFSADIDFVKIPFKEFNMSPLDTDDHDKAYNWIYILYNNLNKYCTKITNDISNSQKNKKLLSIHVSRFKMYKSLLDKIKHVLDFWGINQYVVELEPHKNVKFIPLRIEHFSQFIFDKADHVILMSAVISDYDVFAKTLNIPEYKYIEFDSVFDPKKSPIYCSAKYSLNYANMDQNLPKVVDDMLKLCDKHKNEKGIIHCHSFKITKFIQKRVNGDKRFLFRELGVTNEQILMEHKVRKDPTILVSPSMDTGISLDDDLGRFQIIVKAPYLPLGSKRVKTLFDLNKEWYQSKMLNSLIQSCGRCTRSENDHSVTYILDGAITQTLKRQYKKLPISFKSRIV